MTPDELDAIEAAHAGMWDVPATEAKRLIAALREAWAEVERLRAGNDRLGAMVEWQAEVIVDARDACQRAENIEPMGSPEWVESGIAMRTTALREVRAILDRERNAHPSALDKVTDRAEKAEAAIARMRALTEDEWGPLSDDGERCALCRRKWSKHGNGDEHHHRASSGIAGVVRIILAALEGDA